MGKKRTAEPKAAGFGRPKKSVKTVVAAPPARLAELAAIDLNPENDENAPGDDVDAGNDVELANVDEVNAAHAAVGAQAMATLNLITAPVDEDVATANAAIHSTVLDARRQLISNAEFSDMLTAEEVKLDVATAQSGAQLGIRAHYQEEIAVAALGQHGCHESGLNVFKIDFLSTPLKNAPLNKHKLNWLVEKFFSKPFSNLPYTVTAALAEGLKPSHAWGSLIVVSPPELLWAPVIGAAHMMSNCGLTEEEILSIRRAFLNASVQLKYFSNPQDLLFEAHANRHEFSSIGEIARRTPLQRVFDCLQGASLLPNANVRTFFDLWKKRVADDPSGEPLTKGYIDAVFTTDKKVLQISPKAKQMLLKKDSELPQQRNPFDSIYKIEGLAKKVTGALEVEWVVAAVYDLVETKVYNSKDCTVRFLLGKGGSEKGMVDVLHAQFQLGACLRTWAEEQHLRVACPEGNLGIQWRTSVEYRADLAGDMTWVGANKPSAEKIIRLYEDAVFAVDMQEEVKKQLNSHSPIQDLLKTGTLKARLDSIVEELEADGMSRPVTQQPSHPPGPSSSSATVDPTGLAGQQTPILQTAKLDTEGVLDRWWQYARNLVARRAKFIVFPGTPVAVAEIVKESAVAAIALEPHQKLGVMYDHKLAGEPNARVQTRLVPFREQHCGVGVKGTLPLLPTTMMMITATTTTTTTTITTTSVAPGIGRWAKCCYRHLTMMMTSELTAIESQYRLRLPLASLHHHPSPRT